MWGIQLSNNSLNEHLHISKSKVLFDIQIFLSSLNNIQN